MTQTRWKIGLLVILIVLLIASVVAFTKNPSGSKWQSYTENDYSFKISAPSDWIIEDRLTKDRCCLFVAYWTYATTTEMGTTTLSTTTPIPIEKVTSREFIKLQIGGYDKAVLDPFKAATTSIVRLGKQNWYVGQSGAMTFYLLPRSETTGIGVAQFIYQETTPEQIEMAKKIVSTIELLPQDNASSTSSGSPRATPSAAPTASSTKTER